MVPHHYYTLLKEDNFVPTYNMYNDNDTSKFAKEKIQASSIQCIGWGTILAGNYPRKQFLLATDNGKILSKSQGTPENISRNGV